MKGIVVSASLVVAAACLLGSASAAPAYDVVTVTDGGSIKGKVVSMAPSHPSGRSCRRRTARCAAAACARWIRSPSGPTRACWSHRLSQAGGKGQGVREAAKTPELNNVKCDFDPHVQVMPAGDIVVVNSDPVLHNTKSFIDKAPVFNLALPNQGQRITRAIKSTGIMRVECDAHGWMLGWVYVADNPYYAITAKDGTFAIADVPPAATPWSPGTNSPEPRRSRSP